MVSVERMVNIMEPDRETIVASGRIAPSTMPLLLQGAIKLKQKFLLCPDVVHDSTGFMMKPIKEKNERDQGHSKKDEGEGLQDRDHGETQELIAH